MQQYQHQQPQQLLKQLPRGRGPARSGKWAWRRGGPQGQQACGAAGNDHAQRR